MTDFKSEMREVLEKSITQLMTWQDKKRNKDWIDKECDLALSSLLALIEKRMPKDRGFGVKSKEHIDHHYHGEAQCFECDENKGFNQCLSEIKSQFK
mgnify:CR=1 FL=1